MTHARRLVPALVLVLSCGVFAHAQPPVTIAAAASLNGVLPELMAAFERKHGAHLDVVFGASGVLTRQITDGAPFDLFLAADEGFPNRLTAAGLTRDAGVVYATGRLAVFAPAGSPLRPDAQLAGLEALVRRGFDGRFAIANPDVAPYGRAAEAVLRRHGLWERLRPNLVLGDSITQAAQFATTGNAAGGLLAYSLIASGGLAGRGTWALISESDYPPLRQRMVLLKRAGAVARDFYAFLQTPEAAAIFDRHGFLVPK